jgi:ParB-like chromosome segregation protein Spo0J
MSTPSANAIELDLHRLDTPYAQARVQRPQQVRRLMASIDAHGQQVALTVVGGPQRFVLVDGYLRWQALTRLGRDTAWVEVWGGAPAAALMQVLARRQGRSFEPIEQAWLLAAALAEGLSQRALATALGRDVSWVSRRLALLSALSEPMQEAVRAGVLSSWAASRVLVPLARANRADAQQLLAALRQEPLSTRELATWYAHYSQAEGGVRRRMLAQPRLFIQALHSPETTEEPLAQWLAALQRVRRKIQHLERGLGPLLDESRSAATRAALAAGVEKTRRALEHLHQPLREDAHVVRAATPDDPRAQGQRGEHPPDCTPAGTHPAHGAPGAQAGTATPATRSPATEAIARHCLDAAHALLREPGQRGADAAALA